MEDCFLVFIFLSLVECLMSRFLPSIFDSVQQIFRKVKYSVLCTVTLSINQDFIFLYSTQEILILKLTNVVEKKKAATKRYRQGRRKAILKGRGKLPPCLLIFLKRGGRGGRSCSLKLVLQINFF